MNLESKRAIIRAKMERMRVEEMAKRLNAKLRADDPRLNGAVHVVHHDSTSLIFDRAFAIRVRSGEEVDDDTPVWLIVLTEHHGAHVYRDEDMTVVRAYKRGTAIEEIKA